MVFKVQRHQINYNSVKECNINQLERISVKAEKLEKETILLGIFGKFFPIFEKLRNVIEIKVLFYEVSEVFVLKSGNFKKCSILFRHLFQRIFLTLCYFLVLACPKTFIVSMTYFRKTKNCIKEDSKNYGLVFENFIFL